MNYHLQQSEEISVNFEQEKPDTDDKVVYDPINKYFQNWQPLTYGARSKRVVGTLSGWGDADWEEPRRVLLGGW